MATAAELLAQSGVQDDTLVIDNYLRTISIPSHITNLGVESDDDVLRLNFRMPRYLDDTDLSAFTIRINYMNANGDGDVYTVNDKVVATDSITFSWLVGPTATAYKGSTKFNVCLKIVGQGGYVEKEYNTTIASLPVLEGLEVDEQVVTMYSDVLEQWRRELFGIGDTEEASMREVSQTEQENIVKKGAEVIASIPKEYLETAEAAQECIRTKADAIVQSAHGNPIVVSDSSDGHIRGLKLFGKTTQVKTTGAQVIPRPYCDSSVVRHGVTFTVNKDGSITMVGTNTAPDNVLCYFMLYLGSIPTGVYTYTCYGLPQTCVTNVYFRGDVAGEESALLDLYDGNEYGFVIRIKSGVTVNATVYPMLNAGDTALPYEPYSGGTPSPNPDYPQDLVSPPENITTTVYGKNFWPVDHIELTGSSRGDVIFEGRIPLPATLSWTQDFVRSTGSAMFSYEVDGKTYFTASAEAPGRFMHIIDKDGVLEKITLLNWAEETGNLTDIQLELGSEATDYEPYHDVQNIEIQRTIRGIPVNSGGNYTDPNGQQWICDEVDFERGVYVQRIAKRIITGTEHCILNAKALESNINVYQYYTESTKPIANVFYCSHFSNAGPWDNGLSSMTNTSWHTRSVLMFKTDGIQSLEEFVSFVSDQYAAGTPVTVLFAMETPVETPLTAEEIAAFKTLRTNYPNTIVLSDAGICVEVSYNADTKNYVNPLYVDIVLYDDGNGISSKSDTDFATIKKAYDDGRVVICKQGTLRLPMSGINSTTAAFSIIRNNLSYYYTIKSSGEVTCTTHTLAYNEDLKTLRNEMALLRNSSKVYIGTSEPTDSNVDVWIDTDDIEISIKYKDPETGEWVVVRGAPGKSAYDYAVDGGYAGDEEDFAAKMAEDPKYPLYVTVTDNISNDRLVTYSADKTFGEIATAYANGRVVLCKFANKLFLLDTVQSGNAAAFSTLYKETHHRVTIYNSGTVKYEAFKITLESNDEKYFDMDANGVISLKPEYRGASTSDSEDMEYSVSDNGYGLPGSKNCDLPEALVIPETIGGYRVAGYEVGMFYKNSRLKKLTLLSSVTEIPKGFCSNCINLRQIVGTDRVTYIGEQAFAYTAITEVRFPRLTGLDTLKGKQFMCCAHLTTADLGTKTTKITKIPDKCFYACEYLGSLEGCDNVTELGVDALYHTKNLKELPFRDKLTTIGTDALYLSRANKDNAESFIGSSIVPKYTGKKHYNRIRSTFEQHNPLWANKYIINHQDGEVSLKRKYNAACMYMSAFVVYSALKKITMFSPEDFANEIFEAHPELAKQDAGGDGTWSALKNLVKTMMGYEGTLYESVTTDSIQAVYDALLEGALVITRIPGDNTRVNGVLDVENHMVVIYGINEDGEVMVVDSSTAASRAIGVYEASTYTMPIQNMCRPDDIFMIVPAPPTST